MKFRSRTSNRTKPTGFSKEKRLKATKKLSIICLPLKIEPSAVARPTAIHAGVSAGCAQKLRPLGAGAVGGHVVGLLRPQRWLLSGATAGLDRAGAVEAAHAGEAVVEAGAATAGDVGAAAGMRLPLLREREAGALLPQLNAGTVAAPIANAIARSFHHWMVIGDQASQELLKWRADPGVVLASPTMAVP